MFHTRAAIGFAGLLLISSAALAIDPTAAEFSVSFAQAPKIKINPKPTKVELDTAPDDVSDLALLEIDGNNPKGFLARNAGATGYRLEAEGLKIGARPYGDRDYEITTLPEAIAGLPMLRTVMGHKGVVDGRFAVSVNVESPCYVLMAIDERALETFKKHGAPAWLQEYAPTEYRIETNDPVMAETKAGYAVFARKVPSGRVIFGPPCNDVNLNCMYFAFFAEAK